VGILVGAAEVGFLVGTCVGFDVAGASVGVGVGASVGVGVGASVFLNLDKIPPLTTQQCEM
jgi:hypothetical protein